MIRIEREDGWRRLRSDVAAPEDLWELLTRNASRRGPGRFVLATGPGGFGAELIEDQPESDRIDPAVPTTDWPALLQESGWPVLSRGNDRLAIELEVPGHSAQARFIGTDDGASVSVDVASAAGLSPLARRAMAGFVLVLSERLRLVRAAANEQRNTIRLEVRLSVASTRDLDLALSALSVGFRLAARELRALANDRLAALYLDHLNLTRIPCVSTKEPAFSCSM